MKTGKTLQEMAVEVERQMQNKKDFIADSRAMKFTDRAEQLVLENIGAFSMNELCHEQIATKTGVPQKFYDRLKVHHPDLLATTINHLWQNEPSKQMVRTIDGTARAYVSERYRPLDNYDLLSHCLPILQQRGLALRSAEITDRRMYIKTVVPELQREIQGSKRGDIISIGIMISNSEVGCGSLLVVPFCEVLRCLNGMVLNESGMRKYHVGRNNGKNGNGDDNYEYLSDETKQAEDKAVWLRFRDSIADILTDDFADKVQRKFVESTEVKIEQPQKIIELVAKEFSLRDKESESLMKHLINGGELNAWGMSNAITEVSKEAVDYERATELERVGVHVIELPQKFWS